VRSGQTVVPQLFGVHIYEYYAAHSEDRACFSRATRHIMDVGGADGGLLLAILDVNPEVRGTVFDQPHVVEAARQAIHAKNYQARCEVVGGDFFQAVPSADLYVLKFILVDWKDEDALRILQNCRTAVCPDGKLLVIEMTIPDDNHPSAAQLFDLNMFVMTGGARAHGE
jgi:spermidine synthase